MLANVTATILIAMVAPLPDHHGDPLRIEPQTGLLPGVGPFEAQLLDGHAWGRGEVRHIPPLVNLTGEAEIGPTTCPRWSDRFNAGCEAVLVTLYFPAVRDPANVSVTWTLHGPGFDYWRQVATSGWAGSAVGWGKWVRELGPTGWYDSEALVHYQGRDVGSVHVRFFVSDLDP